MGHFIDSGGCRASELEGGVGRNDIDNVGTEGMDVVDDVSAASDEGVVFGRIDLVHAQLAASNSCLAHRRLLAQFDRGFGTMLVWMSFELSLLEGGAKAFSSFAEGFAESIVAGRGLVHERIRDAIEAGVAEYAAWHDPFKHGGPSEFYDYDG